MLKKKLKVKLKVKIKVKLKVKIKMEIVVISIILYISSVSNLTMLLTYWPKIKNINFYELTKLRGLDR